MNDMSEEVLTEPKKKSNKLWIFGGMGCLLMVLLCVGGLGVAFYFGQDLAQEMVNVTFAIEASPEVEAEVGSPVTVTVASMGQPETVDGEMYTTLSGTVSGPDGNGVFKALFTRDGVDYELKSLTVDVNDKQIEISDEEELDLGIDLGE